MKPASTLLLFVTLALAGAPLAAAAEAPADKAAPVKLDPKSPEGRAVARWQLIIDGKAQKAWDYLSPGVRSARPRDQWAKEVSERPVHWESVQFKDKACDSDEACLVRLQVQYTAPLQGAPGGMLSSPSFLTERWIKVKRQWYFVPDDYVAGGLR
jgi:hypothetical protein